MICSVVEVCKALFDNVADDETELSFKQGDLIEIEAHPSFTLPCRCLFLYLFLILLFSFFFSFYVPFCVPFIFRVSCFALF